MDRWSAERRRGRPRARRPGPLERTQPARLAIKPQGQRSAGERQRTARQSAQGAWGLARAQSQQTAPAPSAPPAAKSAETRAAAAKSSSNEASPELGAASGAYSLPPRAGAEAAIPAYRPSASAQATAALARRWRARHGRARPSLHDALRASAGLGLYRQANGLSVMAGLVPAMTRFWARQKFVDGRDEPGHDEVVGQSAYSGA